MNPLLLTNEDFILFLIIITIAQINFIKLIPLLIKFQLLFTLINLLIEIFFIRIYPKL